MLIINIVGVVIIGLIVWWFWVYTPKAESLSNNNVVIVVESGVYKPSHILLESNKATEFTFLRKDESPCSETLLFPGLDINETLPLNKPKSVKIPKLDPGIYEFHCQMQMYKGVLKVT